METLVFQESVTPTRSSFETRGMGGDVYPDIYQCERLLARQPAGSLIGVQLALEQVNFTDQFSRTNGNKISIALGDTALHERNVGYPFGGLLTTLARQANAYEQTVVFLQDEQPALQAELAMARAQAIGNLLIGQARNKSTRLPHMDVEIEKQDQKLVDQRYSELIAGHYAHTITLPDLVAEKILSEKPDIAFVHEFAAILLAADKDPSGYDSLLRVIESGGSQIQLVGINWRESARKGLLNWEKKVDEYMKLREHYTRQRNAIETGRILTDGQPAWTGTFTPEPYKPSAEGLFEVYPARPGLFAGVIEDAMGTAQFTGTINENVISFRKTYIPGQTLIHDTEYSPLIYQGKHQGSDEYKGEWVSVNNARFKGEFVIRKTSNSN